MYIQQGDCIFIPCELPENLKELNTDIVQEGEMTGHAHRLYGDGFAILEDTKKEKYLRLVKPTALKHEEHHEINLPAGDYVVRIVREYDHFTEEARKVAD